MGVSKRYTSYEIVPSVIRDGGLWTTLPSWSCGFDSRHPLSQIKSPFTHSRRTRVLPSRAVEWWSGGVVRFKVPDVGPDVL